MLLSGPSGVGKTMTAVSVAEDLRVPLHAISAGDLDLTSSDVDAYMPKFLQMCSRWNAVLLLDESDVFLKRCSTQDLERSKRFSRK